MKRIKKTLCTVHLTNWPYRKFGKLPWIKRAEAKQGRKWYNEGYTFLGHRGKTGRTGVNTFKSLWFCLKSREDTQENHSSWYEFSFWGKGNVCLEWRKLDLSPIYFFTFTYPTHTQPFSPSVLHTPYGAGLQTTCSTPQGPRSLSPKVLHMILPLLPMFPLYPSP